MIAQIAIMFTGLIAILLTNSKNDRIRKWAPIFGLCGQPFWIWSTYDAQQWGILALTPLYTFAWLRGLWNYWR